jgi:hypothetical protein
MVILGEFLYIKLLGIMQGRLVREGCGAVALPEMLRKIEYLNKSFR